MRCVINHFSWLKVGGLLNIAGLINASSSIRRAADVKISFEILKNGLIQRALCTWCWGAITLASTNMSMSILNSMDIKLTINIVDTRNTRRKRRCRHFELWHVLRTPSKIRVSCGENWITAGRNSDRTEELANLDDRANLSRMRCTSWRILDELTAKRNILWS